MYDNMANVSSNYISLGEILGNENNAHTFDVNKQKAFWVQSWV